MATRFYFPSSGAAAVSPDYNAGWEDTSIGARLKAVTTKIGSSMTSVSFDDANSTNQDILFRQYVSDPIAAQTIAQQNTDWQIRCSETSTSNNLYMTFDVRVVSNDGSTVRGTIMAMRRDSTEAAEATLTNRRNIVASTEVVASEGDRIVFEIGMGGDPSGAAHHDSSMSFGDDSGTDLPENDTETAAYNPWFEFPTSITFASSGITGTASITQAANTVSGTGELDIEGTASITQAGDTVSATGELDIDGTASITQAGDTVAGTGALAITATASITQAGNTLAGEGTSAEVGITGTASITQAGNTLAATVALAISASASITQDGDTAAGTGALALSASATITQAGDTVSGTGALTITATASITQTGDTVAGTATLSITGTASITQSGDTLAASGTITSATDRTGTLSITLDGDTLSAVGFYRAKKVYVGLQSKRPEPRPFTEQSRRRGKKRGW